MILKVKAFLVFVLFSFSVFSQNQEGDFKLKKSGSWDNYTVWEVFESGVWRNTFSNELPISTSNVYISNNLTVSVVQPNMICNNIEVYGEIELSNPNRLSSINSLIVNGNTTVFSSGKIISNGTKGYNSNIVLKGNLINEGEIISNNYDRYNREAFFSLRFEGSENITINGDGNFDLQEVVVIKDSNKSKVQQSVTFGNVPNYSVIKGSLVLDGNFSQALFINDDSYDVINNNVSIKVKGNAKVIFPDAIKVYGELFCENGEITVGDNSNEGVKIDYFDALLQLDNGIIDINGNIDIAYGSLEINEGELNVQIAGEQEYNSSFNVRENGDIKSNGGKITIYNGSSTKQILNILGEYQEISGAFKFKNNSNLKELKITADITFSDVNFDLDANTLIVIENSNIKFNEEINGEFDNLKLINSTIEYADGSSNETLTIESLRSAEFTVISANSILVLRGGDVEIKSLQVISMNGSSRKLKLLSNGISEKTYDTSALASGIYIVYATSIEGRSYTEKILIP